MPCSVYRSQVDLVDDSGSVRTYNNSRSEDEPTDGANARTERAHQTNSRKSLGLPPPCKGPSCADTRVTDPLLRRVLLRFNTELPERSSTWSRQSRDRPNICDGKPKD
jgi:hypothetical protein